MAYVQDTTQSFAITLVALPEGQGVITIMIVHNTTSGVVYEYNVGTGAWSPSPPEAVEGDSITSDVGIVNNGDASDTIFGQFVSAQLTPSQPLIQEAIAAVGQEIAVSWSFTMPPNSASITINAGHVE
ncbi:unnamed protein product [marine sediment metagenome]|uniref:Uncharacterized protein n=1 Tax=marine sediment metagenome TaxID=412755 RepID=X0WJH8_9ZZZZ